MNIRLKPLLPVAGLFLLFLGLACQNGDTPTLPSPVGPEIISPTAVPPQAKELAREFAQAHRQLDQELDQFHADFDTWRQGLVACESDAAREAYRDFANRFNDVSEKARSLSRPASARELADKLIEATEEEARHYGGCETGGSRETCPLSRPWRISGPLLLLPIGKWKMK